MQKILNLINKYGAAIRFLVVGIISFGIDYGLLLITNKLLHWPLGVATTAGFLAGLLINFLLNKYWTFDAPKSARHSARQALLYALLVTVNLGFTNLFILSLAAIKIDPALSKPVATGLIMVLNYVLCRTVIFV